MMMPLRELVAFDWSTSNSGSSLAVSRLRTGSHAERSVFSASRLAPTRLANLCTHRPAALLARCVVVYGRRVLSDQDAILRDHAAQEERGRAYGFEAEPWMTANCSPEHGAATLRSVREPRPGSSPLTIDRHLRYLVLVYLNSGGSRHHHEAALFVAQDKKQKHLRPSTDLPVSK
ncbi:hypothetical protein J3459_002397 [Metarhizium acridum]|nr:hypothetical protein J3459_002397 [Metarhizium acridum]